MSGCSVAAPDWRTRVLDVCLQVYASLGVTDPWRGVETVALSLSEADEVIFQQPKHSWSEQSVYRSAYRRSLNPTANQTGGQLLTIRAQITQNGHSINAHCFTVAKRLTGTIVHGVHGGRVTKKKICRMVTLGSSCGRNAAVIIWNWGCSTQCEQMYVGAFLCSTLHLLVLVREVAVVLLLNRYTSGNSVLKKIVSHI